MPIAEPLQEELTDAVYRAALEPAAWPEVMRLMNARFPSSAQTFYFLDLEPRRVRPICLLGVAPRWVQTFDELYFGADNRGSACRSACTGLGWCAPTSGSRR
jgi:hypothetical protein